MLSTSLPFPSVARSGSGESLFIDGKSFSPPPASRGVDRVKNSGARNEVTDSGGDLDNCCCCCCVCYARSVYF